MKNWNTDFFEKLYAKLSVSLIENSRTHLFTMSNPGKFLPSGLNPGVKLEDAAILSSIVEQVPEFSWVEKQKGRKISEVYNSILNYKESPANTGTPERMAKLREAEMQYDRYIEEYQVHKYAYDAVQLEYLSAKATQENGGAKIPRTLMIKHEQTVNKWIARGRKNQVELSLAIIKEYQPLDAANFWKQAGEQFQNGQHTTNTGAVFQLTDFYPNYKYWFENSGWSAFSFDQQDLDQQRKSGLTGLTGDLDPSFGIFNLSNKQSDRNQQSFLKMEETAVKVECQLKQIHIERKWLKPLVLSSNAWRMDKNSAEPNLSLSSGADLEKGIVPVGEMTLLPVSAIICKNLKVNGRFADDVVQKINGEIERNELAVGFGPFAIADQRYGQNERVRGMVTNQVIEVTEEQIIGIICEILPKMPNPNPQLPWKK
ncbi:hypothetical protein SAMN05421820_101730 [Pedobacter steynii]|uniref:Uncharacterized protein n=1 Tax=Pedobacter steynii TaxID=430522 RepID=A0A1G9L1S5_9SPHI|nr:hypothetical protein [Pedobacter steynii]NQX38699.1 hypothetical protein [Pedobacter steynii]SDL55723.1 hypothetical protein SAMN05421820_101730 [Pedobacter steynii]